MKTLIVYYSFTGNNKKLVSFLRERLKCKAIGLETVKKRNGLSVFLDLAFNRRPTLKPLSEKLEDFDHIIFIAPIWAGRIAMPLMGLLEKEVNNIKSYSFITVCGGGNNLQKDKIKSQLRTATGRGAYTVTELWVTKVMDFRKDAGTVASSVKISADDFKIFHQELESFIDEVSNIDLHNHLKSTAVGSNT